VSKTYVSKALRRLVAAQAKQRCGYCLSPQSITGTLMEIEHIIPESAGGLTTEANLWLACKLCNDHKGDRIDVSDPLTNAIVPLFNPRTQQWREHFAWTAEGNRIIGLTPTGRATVMALKLNRAVLVEARRVWVAAGLHPPKE